MDGRVPPEPSTMPVAPSPAGLLITHQNLNGLKVRGIRHRHFPTFKNFKFQLLIFGVNTSIIIQGQTIFIKISTNMVKNFLHICLNF